MRFFFYPFFFFFNLCFIIAQAATDKYVEKLYAFPNGTRVDSFIVLPDDSLLLTLSTEPSLYRFDFKTSKKPELVRKYPGKTALLGIAQINSSTIALVAGGATGSYIDQNEGAPGTFAIYLVSLSGEIKASFPISQAYLLKGLTTLPQSSDYLLISDPALGVVWRLNIVTGAIDKPFSFPDFEDSFGNILAYYNDIHVRGEFLYYTERNHVNRFHITPDGTPINGKFKSSGDPFGFRYLGDFLVRPNNTLLLTAPIENTIFKLKFFGPDFPVIPVLIGDPYVPGVQHPSALACANRRCNIVYVVTIGNLPEAGFTARDPDAAAIVVGPLGGSQILKVDLDLAPSNLPILAPFP